MPSNLFTQQYVSETAPSGAVLGDEWLNSTTGKLYKQTLVNGVVSWADISPLPTPGIPGSVLTSNGSNWISGTVSISGGGGSGLSPTSIKTSAYTAVVNEMVRCDTTAGAFSITFPASPTDGAMIGVVDITNYFGTNNLTLLPNTGKTIESDGTSYILDISGTAVTFVYNIGTTNWRLLQTPSAVTTLGGNAGSSGVSSVGAGIETNFLFMGA
jgi:hypothetical protein